MDGKYLACTKAVAAMVRRPEATIRTWAARGLIQREGTGPRKTTLYDLEAVLDALRHAGKLPPS